MKDVGALLDHGKAKQNGASDYSTAKRLKVSPSLVYDWRAERRFPTQVQLLELCDLAQEDPAYWHFVLESRRAKTAKLANRFRAVAEQYA